MRQARLGELPGERFFEAAVGRIGGQDSGKRQQCEVDVRLIGDDWSREKRRKGGVEFAKGLAKLGR